MLAYHQSKILHHDVRTGNILLTQDCVGSLNDWDHAIRIDTKKKSDYYRTVRISKCTHTTF